MPGKRITIELETLAHTVDTSRPRYRIKYGTMGIPGIRQGSRSSISTTEAGSLPSAGKNNPKPGSKNTIRMALLKMYKAIIH